MEEGGGWGVSFVTERTESTGVEPRAGVSDPIPPDSNRSKSTMRDSRKGKCHFHIFLSSMCTIT